jgi:hypothetical protein
MISHKELLFDALDKHGNELDSGAIVIASKAKFRVRKPWFSDF